VENAKLEELRIKSEAQLEKSRLTSKTLDMLNNLSSVLNIFDLEYVDLLQLPRIIEGFKKLGWDITTIIDKYKTEQDLELGIKNQESKMKRYEAVLEDLHRKRMEEERKWGIYCNGIQIFNQLVESGIRPDDIFKVSYILKNNFTKETFSQLVEDIENMLKDYIIVAFLGKNGETDKTVLESAISDITPSTAYRRFMLSPGFLILRPRAKFRQ